MKILIRKLFSNIVYIISRLEISRKFASRSLGVQSTRIEINGACNAKCTFCHSGSLQYDKSKHMSVELFDSILSHLSDQKILTRHVWLYDRGEPLLHPDIGKILDTCRKYGVKARISTNGTKVPDLTRKQWSTISMLKVSMCGITEETYKRVYGLNIDIVKRNTEKIAKLVSPLSYTQLSWLRYTFNLIEEEEAKKWSEKLGYKYEAVDAEVIEMENLISLADGTLNENEIKNIEKILLVQRSKKLQRLLSMNRGEIHYPETPDDHGFHCAQFDQISVNYDGQQLKCCSISPEHVGNRLGNILDVDKESIKRQNYAENNICSHCVALGLAQLSNESFAKIWGS